MKRFYSASELAGLPEMPSTARGVKKTAKRQQWDSRPRTGRGGGLEYAHESLPEATQNHLDLTRIKSLLSDNSQAIQNGELADVSSPIKYTIRPKARSIEEIAYDKEQASIFRQSCMAKFACIPFDSDKSTRARARYWVLKGVYNVCKQRNRGMVSAIREFLSIMHTPDSTITPEWVTDMIFNYKGRKFISCSTVRLWHFSYKKKGMLGLVDHYGARANRSKIETNHELYRLVLGTMIKYPHISGVSMVDFMSATNATRQKKGMEPLPGFTTRTFHRWRNGWIERNKHSWVKITNPDQYKNIYMVAIGSQTEAIAAPNALWELDSTPADWMLIDGRHSVVGVIDIYTRRLKYFVSKTSKSSAVCQVFRRAVLDWGVPLAVRTDNGQDYVSDQFDSVLTDLEIDHQLCIPFASEEKGCIERAMRTMSHGILNLLPGFIGHNVAERKTIEARKSFASRIMTPGEVIDCEMGASDLQQHLDSWCEHIYGRDIHSSIGVSPFKRAADYGGATQRISDVSALDMLLCALAGVRTVTKKGIRFNGHHYANATIGEHVGQQVLLRFDENDIGRLYPYLHNQFLGVLECPEITGISRQELAVATKAKQRKLVNTQTAEMRAMSKDIKQNPAQTVLEHRVSQSEKVVMGNFASSDYSTPGLQAAADAVRGDVLPVVTPLSEVEQAMDDTFAQTFAATEDPLLHFGRDAADDFEMWQRLDDRVQAGEKLLPRERAIWTSFPQSDAYKSIMRMHAAFAREDAAYEAAEKKAATIGL